MFVGCSEISITVIVTCATRWNYQGFLSAWGDLLSFSVPKGQKKLLGCGLLGGAGGGSVPRLTLYYKSLLIEGLTKN